MTVKVRNGGQWEDESAHNPSIKFTIIGRA